MDAAILYIGLQDRIYGCGCCERRIETNFRPRFCQECGIRFKGRPIRIDNNEFEGRF